ncbi:hypothetical protein [Flavobacterium sp. GNP001]
MKNKGGAPKKNENEKLQYRQNLSFNEPEHDMLTMGERTSRWENIEDHCIRIPYQVRRYK